MKNSGNKSEAEHRYRTIMMSVGDGVIATDTEGRVEMMNPVAETLTGWKQEEARGKSLEEIFHIINEETRQTVENPVRRVMREGTVIGLANHSVLITKDGTEHPIADSGAPIRNEKGDITGVVLVFRDQTNERITQKALQENERKFRETVKYLDQGFYSVTPEGNLIDHNQAYNHIIGIDETLQLVGQKTPDFWQDKEDRKQYLNELMTHGFIRNFQAKAKKINGEKIVVLLNSHLIKDEKGGLVRIEGTITDFTRMNLMEEALKESETKYRTLFENSQVGMYRSKIDGSAMLDVNNKFIEILGFTREELIGKAGRILWADPEDRDKMMKLLKEQDGILYNYEARVLAKNGEVRDVLASIELHPEERCLDGTMLDITERKQGEEKLRKLNRIYSLLSDINQAIVRTREPNELFEKVCNVAVEQGGFSMAWIGLIDESSQKLRVIAQAGRSNGYLELIDISLNGEPLSYCPIDSTLRQGKHINCDIIENEEIALCQKIAYDLGFRASASLSLKVSGILKGALTFYSDEPDFFDEAELKLLDELALDISFAMEFAEKETIRIQAEKALQESERKFRETVKYLDEGYYSVTTDGLLLEHNEAFNRILGFDISKDMKRAKLPDFWQNPDDRKIYLQELMARGSIMNYLINAKKTDGEKIIVMANAHLVKDENGMLERIEGTFTDFTRLRLVEVELQKQRDRLIEAQAIARLGSWEWDSVRDEISGSDEFYRLFDVSPEGITHFTQFIELLHPDDREYVQRDVADALSQNRNYNTDYRVRMHDGSWRTMNARGQVQTDLDNKTVKMFGTCLDITERKLAEEALKISKERLLFATEGANLGIWNWDTITGELIWSNKCKALFGIPPDETMSYQRFSEALHPDDRERTDMAVTDSLDNHKDYDIEYRSLWPDDSIHWLAAKGRGFYDATGKAVRLEGIVLDIAESKRKEEEIRKLNAELEDRVATRTAQLEDSYKELEAFTYSVSHDLRAPLRHISGYVNLLSERFQDSLPEKGKHYLDSIADSTKQMGKLIDDLLQFSRTGRQEMQQANLDMNLVLQEALETVKQDTSGRSIEWVIARLPHVFGDQNLLLLVWINLLSNAVKFTRTKDKGRIETGFREENNEYLFFIRDNGVGFDMQYAHKLFGVFQRLHSSEEFEGTGVGLANVNRIILKHGGRTWAEAELDKGAAFYFTLPKK